MDEHKKSGSFYVQNRTQRIQKKQQREGGNTFDREDIEVTAATPGWKERRGPVLREFAGGEKEQGRGRPRVEY